MYMKEGVQVLWSSLSLFSVVNYSLLLFLLPSPGFPLLPASIFFFLYSFLLLMSVWNPHLNTQHVERLRSPVMGFYWEDRTIILQCCSCPKRRGFAIQQFSWFKEEWVWRVVSEEITNKTPKWMPSKMPSHCMSLLSKSQHSGNAQIVWFSL